MIVCSNFIYFVALFVRACLDREIKNKTIQVERRRCGARVDAAAARRAAPLRRVVRSRAAAASMGSRPRVRADEAARAACGLCGRRRRRRRRRRHCGAKAVCRERRRKHAATSIGTHLRRRQTTNDNDNDNNSSNTLNLIDIVYIYFLQARF